MNGYEKKYATTYSSNTSTSQMLHSRLREINRWHTLYFPFEPHSQRPTIYTATSNYCIFFSLPYAFFSLFHYSLFCVAAVFLFRRFTFYARHNFFHSFWIHFHNFFVVWFHFFPVRFSTNHFFLFLIVVMHHLFHPGFFARYQCGTPKKRDQKLSETERMVMVMMLMRIKHKSRSKSEK